MGEAGWWRHGPVRPRVGGRKPAGEPLLRRRAARRPDGCAPHRTRRFRVELAGEIERESPGGELPELSPPRSPEAPREDRSFGSAAGVEIAFRETTRVPPFLEGWALYAERLAGELGLSSAGAHP